MTRKPVLMLTHVTARDAGQIAVIVAALGHPVEVLRLNKGAPLPENIEDYAGFVSFGGPASANDEHIDYIRAELDWMPRVIALGVPLLGVCLGAQLVARSLGAAVALHAEGLYEFGYYPVTPLGDGDDLQMGRSRFATAMARASNCLPVPHIWRGGRVFPTRRSATAPPVSPYNSIPRSTTP